MARQSSSSLLIIRLLTVLALCGFQMAQALDKSECSVCFAILEKLEKNVKAASDASATEQNYADEFLDLCSHPTKNEKSFCYYMGGDKNSATRTYGEMVKKLSQGIPIAKVCDYINKQDPQICQLREKQTVKLKDLDFKSMKVSQLRRILNDLGDSCKGCVEKSEYISRLNKLRDEQEERVAEL